MLSLLTHLNRIYFCGWFSQAIHLKLHIFMMRPVSEWMNERLIQQILTETMSFFFFPWETTWVTAKMGSIGLTAVVLVSVWNHQRTLNSRYIYILSWYKHMIIHVYIRDYPFTIEKQCLNCHFKWYPFLFSI